MALSMAACGKAGNSPSSTAGVGSGFKIGLALPENQTARYEAQDLLQTLGSKATPNNEIIMVNGDPGDPNAAQFKAGAHSVLDGKIKIGSEFDTDGWLANNANSEVAGAVTRLGNNGFVGVYSANDGMAAGIISALQAAHINPLPPVTGQDAQLDGVQRVVEGLQALTIYKPYRVEAETAAQLAVGLATEKPLSGVTD